MSVFLNSREIHNSLFTMRSSKMKFRSCESHTFSKHLIFSLYFTYFSSHFFAPWSENTRWLFIEKTSITTCNILSSQCNRLFQGSNQLYYHFDRLKCYSLNLENCQEQCNRLDSWFNQLKCSWSLLGTRLRTK